tara:strand:- start:2340 stop:3143 length:804 start_codon:yes stop_codon:yes gene_type:complete
MELTLDDNRKFEKLTNIFQHVSSINDQYNIYFSNKGLFMQGFDKTKISILELFLIPEWFTTYKYEKDGESVLGVNSKTLYKILNTKQDGQKLTICYEADSDFLKIIFDKSSEAKSENKVCKKDFKMALIELDEEILTIPDDEQEVEFIIEQTIFSTNIDNLLMFDDTVNFKINNEFINLSSSGMEGDMEITMDTDNLEEFSADECEEDEFLINQSYALKYIKYICNFSKVTKWLCIKISNDRPLCCIYKISDTDSYLRFYLAPKDNE